MKVKLLSHVRLFVTPWTVARQAPQSMEFSRQEYWSGLPVPYPGDLPKPGIKPGSPARQADTLPYEPLGKPNNVWGFQFFHILAITYCPAFLITTMLLGLKGYLNFDFNFPDA